MHVFLLPRLTGEGREGESNPAALSTTKLMI